MLSDIRSEVLNALSNQPNPVVPGTCFALNQELPKLRRHGIDLLPVVESVAVDTTALSADPNSILRSNIRELLVMYFEIADDNAWDYSSFVRGLPNSSFDHAVTAIRSVWGTNNDARRLFMPEALYNCLCERVPSDSLITTLKRLVKPGN